MCSAATPGTISNIVTHLATWRHILLLQVSLPSLAFMWDCAMKRGGKKKCPLASDAQLKPEGRDEICLLCPAPCSKSNDFSGGKSIVCLFCPICGCVTWGLIFPELTVQPDVAWDGCSVSPAVSMQCGCFSCYCNSSLLLPLSLRLHGKQMRCHGFTGMCMGMWGVSTVRILTMWQHNMTRKKKTHSIRLPGSQGQAKRVCLIYSRKKCISHVVLSGDKFTTC